MISNIAKVNVSLTEIFHNFLISNVFIDFLSDDDPILAIKYFHPSWVSDMQKLALCGQLMGLMNFCSEFSSPEVLSLQNGKFMIERFGRFILAIGTDRNIQESLLKHRSELMVNILKLYHQDIETIFNQFDDPKNFSDKLYHIFETYMPILQYNGNLLQNVYKLFLPKSASNLYLDAIQILEHVASRKGVLGGMILYNNKVLASQLSVDLTKILTATDPVRIKTTAEVERNVNFHVPTGSQILKVYMKLSEYRRLQRHLVKVGDSTSLGIQNSQPLPFSIKKKPKETLSMMKRDKSLIFSNIPEEEALVEIPSPEKSRIFNRPTHLPLKFKTVQSKELPESGIASIMSFDESDSFADFIGRTSVCATPMTENKILTGPMPSIFAIAQASEVKIVEPMIQSEPIKKTVKELEQIYVNFVNNPFKEMQQWKKSWNELNKITDLDDVDQVSSGKKVYNTITDPLFPIFSQKMQPLSKSMFDEYQNLFITNPNFYQPPEPPVQEEIQPKPEPKKFDLDAMIVKKHSENKNSPSKILRNQKKKMMRLPIKSFSSLETDSGKPSTSASVSSNNASIFDSPSTKTKKYMGSLQLTPLMSKLTLLAMSENDNFSSGFSSFDLPTPTPVENTNRTFMNRLSKVEEEKFETKEDDFDESEMKKVDLFVCSQSNMTLMVIADEDLMKSDQQIVQSMFEICVNRLSRLEQKLNEIINVTVDLKASDYSFMNLDKQWDILKRGGAWVQNDLQTLLLMHDNFKNKNISDIIIKTNDSVLYGHNKSGESEIYYQHASQKQSSGGLPAPSDFTIITQAKRRLERDHSLVLF